MPKFYLILLLTALLCPVSRGDVSIVTTIKPLQMIAEAVVQEYGSVSSIVDAQQSPHHFTVSPSDRIALARADITVWIGPSFETRISDFFMQAQLKAKTITVIDTPGLRVHTIGNGQLDAHLWLDSSNAIRIATAIAERAAELDPVNAASYSQNLESFGVEIESRNQQIEQRFKAPSKANYAVYHNAYQYFEQQFGLQHDMVILQDPEVQPGIREIIQLRSQVNEQRPSCLLLDFDSSLELVNTVLNGHELKLITVDLLGSNVDSSENTYSEFISNLTDDFYRCLYE
ncbi:MAG: zinc ABC transporter substrate-binding protein [Gammaproteobacteria bacterium]|nr:zinc ABC transporter substrate-binding protein [Gammaproteobacteria bacterium]